MVWAQLAINKPHLAYLIIGGFTSLFMLCSLFVKEKLYIGEATVATICGIIFGPHAANLFDPGTWGNTDQITLECSRIVLVVQCFAVGVELPKAYMERHWKSVVLLLVPVMTFGWLVTSLFIWWMVPPLSWLESLACAACVTATDPVLASSVVGKGKFAKRVPKHLRDLLSAESGCNDGMAFPFIYLSLYLIRYRPDANVVAYHWLCYTVLYECIFGAVYGVLIGYIGRHAIKWADGKGLIDRESFLVFYFVLALFCAGSGSLLGIDDLLVGFSAGVGFSNDGWFTQKTEESHVSNVIDLLLNLAYFVYLGSIVPWQQYNSPEIGLTPWRLAVIAIMVILFRRIPIVMALKPLIPDIKNWREALFAGHFGPIGVGAIFAAILSRAELETDGATPLTDLPEPGTENYLLIQVIWPITTFLVISSILVHGSTVAVFTLGKRINTLSLTLSYTQANEDGPSWMNRLPRISSTAKASMSKSRDDFSVTSSTEKLPEFPPGTLPPVGLSGNFLRRQKEEDNPSNTNSRASSLRPMRRKKWDSGLGPGGPISQSAITPQRRQSAFGPTESASDTLNEKSSESSDSREKEQYPDGLEVREAQDKKKDEERHNPQREEPSVEAYQEGDTMIIEDEEGNILREEDTRNETKEEKNKHITNEAEILSKETSGEHAKGKFHPHTKNEGENFEKAVADGLHHPSHPYHNLRKKLGTWNERNKSKDAGESSEPKVPAHKRGPAHAYQYGNTIIVEDEDGEVVKKYDIPAPEKKRGQQEGNHPHLDPVAVRQRLHRMGTWAHMGGKTPTLEGNGVSTGPEGNGSTADGKKHRKSAIHDDDDDDRIRFTVTAGGRRMSKQDFIKQIQSLDPKARCEAVEESDVPEGVKEEARQHAQSHNHRSKETKTHRPPPIEQGTSYQFPRVGSPEGQPRGIAEIQKVSSNEDRPKGDQGLTLVTSNNEEIPYHSVPNTLSKYSAGQPETAAQRRRRLASVRKDSDDDGTERIPPHHTTLERQESALASAGETQAERRRRLAALGEGEHDTESDSDSDDDGGERMPKGDHHPVEEPVGRGQQRGAGDGSASGGGAGNGNGGEGGNGNGNRGRAPGIRFAETPAVSQGRVQWVEDVGKRGRGLGR
ncbi:Superoxide dismutase [Mn], mitochondrial [Schaereria dolodes]|nr:Superoxide dismutase [Mn], mitochondrial [Schaereria dolodes]